MRPKDLSSPSLTAGSPKNPDVNLRGETRSNATHQSVPDSDARLARKSNRTACIVGNLGRELMDDRHGLIVGTDVRAPGDAAERDAAVAMLTTLPPRQRRRTLGAEKGCDSAAPVAGAHTCGVTPHVAQNRHARNWRRAIHDRTTRHLGDAISQVKRKRVEEAFGWCKTIGGLRKLYRRRYANVGSLFTVTNAACNLVRMRTLVRLGASRCGRVTAL